MKYTKVKFAAIIGSSMLIAFIVITLVFNVVMNKHIEENAHEAIKLRISQETEYEESSESFYTASRLWLTEGNEPKSYSVSEYDKYLETPYAMSINKWLSENQIKPGDIHFAQIGDRMLYIAIYYTDFFDAALEPIVAYVDVTAEKQIVTLVSTIIFIVMTICSVGACFGGIIIGKKAEQDQYCQKKIYENASHELKTPLMVIQGYADGLSSGVVEDETYAAEIIISESNKMALLIDEILSLSRIENGQSEFTKESISIPEFVNDCIASTEILAEKKRIRIETDIAIGTVEADPVHLEKALTNIITNAVRYANKSIQIKYDGKSLVVRDDGEGVPPDDLKNIFQRFYTGKNGNIGIGLSLTKEIVERHGWKVRAENVQGGMQLVIEMR